MNALGDSAILHLCDGLNEEERPVSLCGRYVNGEGKGLGQCTKDVDMVNCTKCLKKMRENAQC